MCHYDIKASLHFEGMKTGIHLCNVLHLLFQFRTLVCTFVVRNECPLSSRPHLGSHTSELPSTSLTSAMLLSADIPTTSCTSSPSRSKSVFSFVRSIPLCDVIRETRSCTIEWFAQHHRGATRSPQVVDRVFIAFFSVFLCLLQPCCSVICTFPYSQAKLTLLCNTTNSSSSACSTPSSLIHHSPLFRVVHDGLNPPS